MFVVFPDLLLTLLPHPPSFPADYGYPLRVHDGTWPSYLPEPKLLLSRPLAPWYSRPFHHQPLPFQSYLQGLPTPPLPRLHSIRRGSPFLHRTTGGRNAAAPSSRQASGQDELACPQPGWHGDAHGGRDVTTLAAAGGSSHTDGNHKLRLKVKGTGEWRADECVNELFEHTHTHTHSRGSLLCVCVWVWVWVYFIYLCRYLSWDE